MKQSYAKFLGLMTQISSLKRINYALHPNHCGTGVQNCSAHDDCLPEQYCGVQDDPQAGAVCRDIPCLLVYYRWFQIDKHACISDFSCWQLTLGNGAAILTHGSTAGGVCRNKLENYAECFSGTWCISDLCQLPLSILYADQPITPDTPSICVTQCSADLPDAAPCRDDEFCSPAGGWAAIGSAVYDACFKKQGSGEACREARECASGICTDGKCVECAKHADCSTGQYCSESIDSIAIL